MKVSVVVPSFGRKAYLEVCLASIDGQTRPADEVIVVCRESDLETVYFARKWQLSQTRSKKIVVLVQEPGQIAALRMGHQSVSGDIVVFTDDDTAPYPDWIQRITHYYEDPKVGGVGGRDIIHTLADLPRTTQVGRMTWYGRLLGNHHRGKGNPRYVDVLKGANTSFRTELVEFPTFFRGGGAEIHNEVYVCFRIWRMGYRLIYDPQIVVDHFVAPRKEVSSRGSVVRKDVEDAAFNFSSAAIAFLPFHRWLIRVLYVTCLGERGSPGLLRVLIGWIRREKGISRAFLPTQIGHLKGTLYFCRTVLTLGRRRSRLTDGHFIKKRSSL